jgi:hypothetical protein
MNKKFIPNGDLDFARMAEQFARGIARDPARFAVSQEDAQLLVAAAQTFRAALTTAHAGGARSQVATREKEHARVAAEEIIRRIARLIRANDAVDATARFELGMRERTKSPKVLTVPNESPRLRFERAIHESAHAVEHELSFCSLDCKPKAAGAVRLELFLDLVPLDEEVPAHPAMARAGRPFYLRSYTRSPIRITPPMADRPMRVVYWGRWADSTGNVGPFSATAVGWVEGGSVSRNKLELANFGRSSRLEVSVVPQEMEFEPAMVVAMIGERAMKQLTGGEAREVRQLEGALD